MGRFHALLAIKRPMAGAAELQISPSQTQLVDLPATIYAAIGLKVSAPEGQSVFSLPDDLDREIHMFTGIHFKPEKHSDALTLGRDMKELSLAYLGYKPGGVGRSIQVSRPSTTGDKPAGGGAGLGLEPRRAAGLGEIAHAQDISVPLSHRDHAARVEQIEDWPNVQRT